jgi:hypothetical protein
MKVLLGQKSRDENVAIFLIEYLNPDESFSGHDCLHESEVEAPDHNNSQNNCQGRHHNPV